MRFYVYELVDPRDGSAFYVGKGCGKRAWSHEKDVLAGRVINLAKCERIKAIHAAGLSVGVQIVKDELAEDEAFALERERIAANRENLTNVADGGRCPAAPAKESVSEVPLRHLLLTARRTLGVLGLLRLGREDKPFSDDERALGAVVRSAVTAWERLTGESLAGDGMEFEWVCS